MQMTWEYLQRQKMSYREVARNIRNGVRREDAHYAHSSSLSDHHHTCYNVWTLCKARHNLLDENNLEC